MLNVAINSSYWIEVFHISVINRMDEKNIELNSGADESRKKIEISIFRLIEYAHIINIYSGEEN